MQPQGYPYPYPPPPPPPRSNTTLVVAIVVGVVVVIAVVVFLSMKQASDALSYQRRTKRSEAEVNLDAIKKGLKAQLAENGGFLTGAAMRTPATPCCDSGRADRKCEADADLWYGHDVWDALSFSIDEPHYFQYSYSGDATHFVAQAVGDLDCDATEVTYTLEGFYNDGSPTYELTKPARAD